MHTAPPFNPCRSEAMPGVDDGLTSKSGRLPESTIPVGEYAPAFVLPRWDVGSFGFAELLGTPTVLHFYPGSDTDWPQQSAILADLSPKLGRFGVALVGIIAADRSAISVHCKAESITFPLLRDWEPRALVSRLYGFNREKAAPAIAVTFLVDARGIIRWISAENGYRTASGPEILGGVRAHLLRPSPVAHLN